MLTTRAPGSRFAAFLRSGRRAVDQETESLGSRGAGQGQPLGDGPGRQQRSGRAESARPYPGPALFEQFCQPRDRGTRRSPQPGVPPLFRSKCRDPSDLGFR